MIAAVTDVRPTIPALLARCAAGFGDHPYLITPAGTLSYAGAEQRSAVLARWLLAQGVGKGSRVGLFFPNGIDWVLWWLAASRIGALVVPLSTLYPPAELAKVLRLADVGLLVAPPSVLGADVPALFERALDGLAGQGRDLVLPTAPYLRRIAVTGTCDRGWALPVDPSAAAPAGLLAAVEAEVTPADLAVMIHTSGSTADPKGVLHTQGTLVRQTSAWATAIRALTRSAGPPRVLCAMPFFWVGGLLATTGALHEPATVLTLPRLDPGAALDLVETHRAAGVIGWPAFTRRLREHPGFAERDLSCAPMLRDGPVDIAMVDVPDGYPVHRTMSETAGGFVHTELAIVDADGNPVPDGEIGELWVRGIGVMAGYNKRERHETFDPDGWYHTGDRVYRRPGDPRLFYVGRSSELIKCGGANVSPLEVEAALLESPAVAQCVVVGVDDADRGEAVCAVVVPAGERPDPAALAAHARERLSAYKVPTRWAVTTAARIPVLASGKYDRRALRGMIMRGELETTATS